MQDKVTFEYTIIRLVPRVEREEFFNIGVIVFSKPRNFLGIKYHICATKLSAFTTAVDFKFIEQVLNSWELICNGDKNAGIIGALEVPDRFRWLAATKSTILQTSETHSGICENPQKELEEIFNLQVL